MFYSFFFLLFFSILLPQQWVTDIHEKNYSAVVVVLNKDYKGDINGWGSGFVVYNNPKEKERPCKFKSLKNKSYCKRHINLQQSNEISDKCQALSYSKKEI